VPEPLTLSTLDDHWVEQWRRAAEICPLLEETVPSRDERPRLYVVPVDDDREAPDSQPSTKLP
jgi:hypothetical protein